MKSISLYVDQGSWLNKMHPYTKLLYILTAIVIPLIGGKFVLFPIMIACSLFLLASGGILKRALPLVAFSFTLIVVIFLIQGLFNHSNETVLISIGVITFYKEGVLFAAKIGCNILNMLLSFGVFVLTTSPQELVDEFEKNGFSPRFGYIINSVFQILPQMIATKDRITDAQRSRGMETEGNLFERMKAFLPLISPVVMSSLIDIRERAIALEVRGFGRKQQKTWLYDWPKYKWDQLIRIILVLFMLATIVWRVLLCR